MTSLQLPGLILLLHSASAFPSFTFAVYATSCAPPPRNNRGCSGSQSSEFSPNRAKTGEENTPRASNEEKKPDPLVRVVRTCSVATETGKHNVGFRAL